MAEKTITTGNAAEKTSTKDKVYVGAYVPRETYSKLSAICESRELSLSDVVREAIREHLAKQETD
ncbi:MAG: ribbon-helix-helix protein, CopG family [Ruminococcus flavefaciens]|nr:ribbon-helix-helix protein, CopG family [Ruminococcus flavefaciens]